MEKKKWEKPELIILARSRAEEQVLSNCKGGGIAGSSLHHNDQCHSDSDCHTLCRDLLLS